jgi:hypothetical protein
MKKIILFVFASLMLNTSQAQLNMNNVGFVSIGTNPVTPNTNPGLDIYGNRGNINNRNFRVTFPTGGGLAGTELAGLAEIAGLYTWVALYANQGAASWAAYFNGNTYTTGRCYDGSDSALKENFRRIDNPLNKVLAINGVKYDRKTDSTSYSTLPENVKTLKEQVRKDNLGFVAQDLMKIVPEAVIYDEAFKIYGIDYNSILPLLVESIKEQQLIIESLQSEIIELKKNFESNSITKKSTSSATETSDLKTNSLSVLYQNIPNPFSQSTTIEFSLAENIQKAMICIYDLNGTQLKCISLNLSGYGNITLNGGELKAGMYMYSLIVNGQLIDTKRMVLTN